MTKLQYISLTRLDGIQMESKSSLDSLIKECLTPLMVETKIEHSYGTGERWTGIGYTLKITNWDKLKITVD